MSLNSSKYFEQIGSIFFDYFDACYVVEIW